MPSVLKRSSRQRSPEVGRRVFGSLLEVGIKAYGAAAALSVALSDSETVAGKRDDALAAVPNLMERYRDTKYVIDNREDIGNAFEYVHQNAPDSEELEAAAQRGTETLVNIETTYDEVIQAAEAITTWKFWEGVPEAVGHVGEAWEARPDFDSIRHLVEVAESAAPLVEQVEVLVPGLYGGLLTLVDNFAGDEIGATLAVMGAAFAIAYLLGTGVGFWARRGRPGLISRRLQTWGARLFPGWYVRNLEFALGPALHAAARQRTQDDLVADPQEALDPEAFRELELYFERRATGEADRPDHAPATDAAVAR